MKYHPCASRVHSFIQQIPVEGIYHLPRRDWGQEEKGTTEDEMAGWHHGLDGRESE